MITPKIEESRIHWALRACRERGFEVLEPVNCIEKAIDQFGDSLAVSCSFGSCSVVVLHMALQIKPDVKVVFNNTGVEYPETYVYKKKLRKEWSLNLIETKPLKSFWQCIREYGWPTTRIYGSSSRKTGKPACCVFLKDKPAQLVCEKYGIKASLTGLRASESRVRMFVIGMNGQTYHTMKYGDLWKIHPIGFWTHKQVWQYLREHDIPTNPLYSKGIDRSGCMPCTGFIGWEKQLAKTNLKMYRYVQKLRQVSLLDDFLTFEDKIMEPCGQRRIQAILTEW